MLGPDNAWYCPVCQEKREISKQMDIYKAPPILLISLKRFKPSTKPNAKSSDSVKNTALVRFPIEGRTLPRDWALRKEANPC